LRYIIVNALHKGDNKGNNNNNNNNNNLFIAARDMQAKARFSAVPAPCFDFTIHTISFINTVPLSISKP
jgi:hypothetical protein